MRVLNIFYILSLSFLSNAAGETFCYNVETVNGIIAVSPEPGSPPIPAPFFTSVTAPVQAPVPVPVPVPAPVSVPVQSPEQDPLVPVQFQDDQATAPVQEVEAPTNPTSKCVEGATRIYNGVGGWIDIRCPYSCSGCYGVKVHSIASNGVCTERCITPFALGDYSLCGGCPATSTESLSLEKTVPDNSSAGVKWPGGYTLVGLSALSVFLL